MKNNIDYDSYTGNELSIVNAKTKLTFYDIYEFLSRKFQGFDFMLKIDCREDIWACYPFMEEENMDNALLWEINNEGHPCPICASKIILSYCPDCNDYIEEDVMYIKEFEKLQKKYNDLNLLSAFRSHTKDGEVIKITKSRGRIKLCEVEELLTYVISINGTWIWIPHRQYDFSKDKDEIVICRIDKTNECPVCNPYKLTQCPKCGGELE